MGIMSTFHVRFSNIVLPVLFLAAFILFPACKARDTDAKQQSANQEHKGHQQTIAPKRYSRSIVAYTPPKVTLVDMTGAEVPLASALNYEGPVLMQFIFTTCPTICPVMSATFSTAQDKFGADLDRLRMISISIDPEHDTPARLREYAQKFKAKPQWQFLTGTLEDIVTVQKAFGVYRGNKMRHEPYTYLRASPHAPWVRLDGLMSASQLVAEYHKVIAQ